MNETAHYDYVIIGGGVAGTTAAETIRRGDPHASIALFEREEEFLYSRVMLPNFIRGKYNRDAIFLRNRDDYVNQQIDIFRGKKVIAINAERAEVSIGSDEYVHYGKLLIAMGGSPRKWGVKIPKSLPLFRLQTLKDAEKIKKFIAIDTELPRSVAVIGGGFIGLEFIESFVSAGIKVEFFLRESQCFDGRVSDNFSHAIEYIHRGKNIVVHRNSEVSAVVEKSEGVFELDTTSGKVNVNGVALGIGIERNFDLAKKAGLNVQTGILANQYLQTEDPNIFVIGDIAEYTHTGKDGREVNGTWGDATIQGTIGGRNALGEKEPFDKVSTYAIVHFGTHISFIGEKYSKKMEVVVRDGGTHNPYAEFYFLNGTLKGATLVNMSRAVGIFVRWIAEGEITIEQKEQLASPEIAFEDIKNE